MRLAGLVFFVMALLIGGTAIAAEKAPVAPVAYSAIPAPAGPTGLSPLIEVQGYYCSACRRRCVRRFKWDCDASEGWCRRAFTRCMRHCWEDECR